jgi:predicted lipoprotein
MLIPFSVPMIICSGGNIMSLNFARIKKRLRFMRYCLCWCNSRRLALITLLLLGALLLTVSGCKQGDYYLFYFVEEQEKKNTGENRLEYFKEEKFDADKIVADIWDSKVIRTILEQAVDLRMVLDALAQDPEAAGQKYGRREKGGDYPWNFIVKGEGRIVTVNTQSRKGTLTIDVPPYDGKPDATIWIGPIITSYSIRDSLDFISFTSGVVGSSGVQYKFDTQVQFAELSNALNARGNKNILATLTPAMCFKLTEVSFESLKEKKIPDNVLDKLNSLKDNACTSKEQFGETVKKQGGGEVEQYKDDILKSADTSDTGKGQRVRFYGAFTQQKSGEIIIAPVQLEFVKEGQS